jgi:glycosyltransferase involved in cell wall biosynthesis
VTPPPRSLPVSGFSIVRNAVQYGYPIAAALRSLAPLVDELVVAVGDSDDGTLELVRGLGGLGIPRLRIVETVWDETLRSGGAILAQQTNLALSQCRHPWAFYLQADEVVHERDHDRIRAALARWYDDEGVDALQFRFLHFEGTYAYVNYVRYRRQCRIVRNNGAIVSVGDAAGFGRTDGARLRVRPSGATIYHYGWARAPDVMRRKTIAFQKLYHDDAYVAEHIASVPAELLSEVDIAFRFRGTHPAVMHDTIGQASWEVPPDRRPPLDTPLLNPRFYAAWLRKWRILPRPRRR